MISGKQFLSTLLLTILLQFNLEPSLAQGEFLEKGVSGFGMAGGFSRAEDATGFSVGLGYSFKGRIDVAFSLERATTNDDAIPGDLNAIGVGPSLTIHIIKAEKPKDVSIALLAGYEQGFFSGYIIDQNLGGIDDIHSNVFAFGLGFYRSEAISKEVNLIPRLILGYSFLKTTADFTSGGSESHSEKVVFGGFDLNFAINSLSRSRLLITPGVSLSDIGTDDPGFTFSLSLGYVFVTGDKNQSD